MIVLNSVSKYFGTYRVVDNVSLQIKKGEIFGLLGPNAAGKTTIIRMLCNLLSISSGSATIDKLDLLKDRDTLKHKIGYVAQDFGLYDELTVFDNLKFYTSLYGEVDEIKLLELLKKYQITEFKDAKAGSLSGGYKRRLSLCCALSHDPDVIFLDEPTAGIDPVTRKALWDIFYELSQEGKTLFVTTHYMEEAQRCNKIAFLNRGKIVTQGSPHEVENSLDDFTTYRLRQSFNYELLTILGENKSVYLVNQFGDELRIIVKKEFLLKDLEALVSPYLDTAVLLEKTRPNLEDVFIALTQE